MARLTCSCTTMLFLLAPRAGSAPGIWSAGSGLHIRDRTSRVPHCARKDHCDHHQLLHTHLQQVTGKKLRSSDPLHPATDLGTEAPWTQWKAGPRPRPQGHICCFHMVQVTRCTEASRTMAFEKQCTDSLPSKGVTGPLLRLGPQARLDCGNKASGAHSCPT